MVIMRIYHYKKVSSTILSYISICYHISVSFLLLNILYLYDEFVPSCYSHLQQLYNGYIVVCDQQQQSHALVPNILTISGVSQSA
jgi:hypothetical protein